MHFLWTGEKNRPEDAVDYSAAQLLEMHKIHRRAPIIIGNTSEPYNGKPLAPRGIWYEVHTEHKMKDIDHKFWANRNISRTVGLLSGFDTDIALKIITASRMKALPAGAKGASVLFINGPNLNLLGTREPAIYGNMTLAQIFEAMNKRHPELTAHVMQSNAEHDLVNAIQGATGKYDAIIINAAAFTHTSVAIHDALKSFDDIIIEAHISNPHQREDFRHRSFITPAAHGIVAGFGPKSYELALMGVMSKL